MSKDTAIATVETATAPFRKWHLRGIVDAPRNSPSRQHVPHTTARPGATFRCGQARRARRHSRGTREGGGVLGRAG